MAPSGMGHLAEMGKIALDVSTAAAFVIPTAWSSVPVMYMAQSDPAQLWDAAEDWKKAVDEIKSARDKIDDELRTLPDDSWFGKDRDAFEKKMHDIAQAVNSRLYTPHTTAQPGWFASAQRASSVPSAMDRYLDESTRAGVARVA